MEPALENMRCGITNACVNHQLRVILRFALVLSFARTAISPPASMTASTPNSTVACEGLITSSAPLTSDAMVEMLDMKVLIEVLVNATFSRPVERTSILMGPFAVETSMIWVVSLSVCVTIGVSKIMKYYECLEKLLMS